jgi:hypothetical protein
MHMLCVQLHAIRMNVGMQMQTRALENQQGEGREQQNETGKSAHQVTVSATLADVDKGRPKVQSSAER